MHGQATNKQFTHPTMLKMLLELRKAPELSELSELILHNIANDPDQYRVLVQARRFCLPSPPVGLLFATAPCTAIHSPVLSRARLRLL